MRPLRLVLMIVAVIVGVSVVGAVARWTGASGPDRLLSLEEIAQAAEASANATSGRFGFIMEMSLPDGQPLSFSATGSFDTPSGRSAMTLDMSAFGSLLAGFADSFGAGAPDLADPALWKIDAVQDRLVMYMRFPLLAKELPRGKTWVKMDLRKIGLQRGLDLAKLRQFTSSDPRDMLGYLEALGGKLERVGEETLHADETTRYRTTVDLLEYKKLVAPGQREELDSMLKELVAQSGLRMIPVDVWVDGDGLVRRFEMSFSATQPGTSQTVDASMRFELYDYGKAVEIELPPRASVVDALALRD